MRIRWRNLCALKALAIESKLKNKKSIELWLGGDKTTCEYRQERSKPNIHTCRLNRQKTKKKFISIFKKCANPISHEFEVNVHPGVDEEPSTTSKLIKYNDANGRQWTELNQIKINERTEAKNKKNSNALKQWKKAGTTHSYTQKESEQ